VTAGNSPTGTSTRINQSSDAPASTSIVAASTSTACSRANAVACTTRPPAFCAASPYERASPRATTRRGGASLTSRPTSASDDGSTTSAAVGAVPPQPVSSLRIHGDGKQRNPQKTQYLQGPIPQHHVFGRAALALFEQQRVSQNRQHE